MYPPPASELSGETVRRLDDEFFTSDPFSYLRARITTLLDRRTPTPEKDLFDQFRSALGSSSQLYAEPSERTRELQFALDAFALRHHVAESLLRLSHVRLHRRVGESQWVQLSDSPPQTVDLLKKNAELFSRAEDGGLGQIRRHLLCSRCMPNRLTSGEGSDPKIDDAIDLHVDWLNYAIQLLQQPSPDLNAANNKFKHGLGLRAQDDVLSRLIPVGPNAISEIPLSALEGDQAVPLMEGIRAEYLARASGRRRKLGLELTQLSLNPVPTLVEAAALSHTLGLIFHSAADEHFLDHDPPDGRVVPPHPGFLSDVPRPGTLRPAAPFALRFPLTTPVRGGDRTSAEMFWTHGYMNTVQFQDGTSAIVVDDLPGTQ